MDDEGDDTAGVNGALLHLRRGDHVGRAPRHRRRLGARFCGVLLRRQDVHRGERPRHIFSKNARLLHPAPALFRYVYATCVRERNMPQGESPTIFNRTQSAIKAASKPLYLRKFHSAVTRKPIYSSRWCSKRDTICTPPPPPANRFSAWRYLLYCSASSQTKRCSRGTTATGRATSPRCSTRPAALTPRAKRRWWLSRAKQTRGGPQGLATMPCLNIYHVGAAKPGREVGLCLALIGWLR